jgi:hypothetical protein
VGRAARGYVRHGYGHGQARVCPYSPRRQVFRSITDLHTGGVSEESTYGSSTSRLHPPQGRHRSTAAIDFSGERLVSLGACINLRMVSLGERRPLGLAAPRPRGPCPRATGQSNAGAPCAWDRTRRRRGRRAHRVRCHRVVPLPSVGCGVEVAMEPLPSCRHRWCRDVEAAAVTSRRVATRWGRRRLRSREGRLAGARGTAPQLQMGGTTEPQALPAHRIDAAAGQRNERK